jgi:hypothetical protein
VRFKLSHSAPFLCMVTLCCSIESESNRMRRENKMSPD